MKHKILDLQAEVKRATLPDGLEGFLFPLYEAISNSLHSIEDRWGVELEDKGILAVVFDASNRSIQVNDNGNGFDKCNLSAFLTPLTGNKYERGGKGFGRFIAFKFFREVFYSTRHLNEFGSLDDNVYKYEPFSDNDNLIPYAENQGFQHDLDRGISVRLGKPNKEFEHYFDLNDDANGRDLYTEEDILSAVLDHFLIEFMQLKIPKKFEFNISGVNFNLYDYFHASLIIQGEKAIDLDTGSEKYKFKFSYFKVSEDKAKKHRLYFYANNRAASKLENISSGLNDKAFVSTQNPKEKHYYLVAVSSDFFKSSQSRDRITNLNGKIDYSGKQKSLKDHLIAIAKNHILGFEEGYTKKRRAKMLVDVEHLISVDPLLERGLGKYSTEEFVAKRQITENKEQLASDLFVERYRSKFDFSKVGEHTSIEELQKIIRTKIPDDAKEALAVYVAYRNNVISLFKEMLNKQDGKTVKEDHVHQFIYPRYKDIEDVDYSSHNLWLIDDDLAYARYISSDRTPDGNQRAKGEFAHDILINNNNELMIIEMKRPQKEKYQSTIEGSTNNPVDQLKKQISDLRQKGYVKNSKNRSITIDSEVMARGYVLADWNDKLEKYLADDDFIITNYGGKLAYKYFRSLNLMIEVLAFDRLLDRATNRNQAFVKILRGESSYDRSDIDPLT